MPGAGQGMSDRDEHDREDADRDDGKHENQPHDAEGGGDEGDDEAGEKDSGPPLWKKPVFWIILIVVAAVLIVGGTLFWLHKRQYATTDDAFVDAHIVRIAAEVQGKLTQVADIDNRHVKAGTLLATIEPYASAASLDQAKAQAVQADAGIQQAQAQVVSAQAQRQQAEAQARDPEAQAAKAAADLQRYLALQKLDSAAVSGTQIDQAREAAKSSAAQAAAARRAVDNAAAQVAVAQKQVRANEAQKQAAEAQIRSAQVTVGHLDIRAPVSGQVVNRSVNLGRRFPRCRVRRPCGFDPAGRGPGLRPAAAAERDRQLCEGRAARAGAHPVRSAASRQPGPARLPYRPGHVGGAHGQGALSGGERDRGKAFETEAVRSGRWLDGRAIGRWKA